MTSLRCTVERRRQVERAATSLRDTAPTVAVDVLSPVESPQDTWTLEATLRDRTGVPPAVLRELALAGLTYHPQPSQGEHAVVVATA